MSNRLILEQGEHFAREHLHTCCVELRQWHDTGVLPDGRVRELGRMMAALDNRSHLTIAESLIKAAAFDYVIRSAGNVSTTDSES